MFPKGTFVFRRWAAKFVFEYHSKNLELLKDENALLARKIHYRHHTPKQRARYRMLHDQNLIKIRKIEDKLKGN